MMSGVCAECVYLHWLDYLYGEVSVLFSLSFSIFYVCISTVHTCTYVCTYVGMCCVAFYVESA